VAAVAAVTFAAAASLDLENGFPAEQPEEEHTKGHRGSSHNQSLVAITHARTRA
jgi:hypothetical protein